nr:ATP-binding protein [Polyangium spumosum]
MRPDAARHVITSIDIHGLRGIREGKLEGLTPLVVLVGPNGSGKSTILDAMLIGASRRPASSAGYAVKRRSGMRHGARWLLYRGGDAPGRIRLGFADGAYRERELTWSDSNFLLPDKRALLAQRGFEGPYSAIHVRTEPVAAMFPHVCVFAADNEHEANDAHEAQTDGPTAWLADPRHGRPLHDLYSRLTEHGRRAALFELVQPLIPGLRVIEILTEHGDARLNLTFDDRSVPVVLAGDGIQALIRLGLELSTRQEGVVLLEEPEAHQHPAGIWSSASAIAAGVRSGLQIVLTTHSMELVDALLDVLLEDELDLLTVYRLKLDAGRLASSRFPGPDVLHARGEIETDLR